MDKYEELAEELNFWAGWMWVNGKEEEARKIAMLEGFLV